MKPTEEFVRENTLNSEPLNYQKFIEYNTTNGLGYLDSNPNRLLKIPLLTSNLQNHLRIMEALISLPFLEHPKIQKSLEEISASVIELYLPKKRNL